MARTNNKNKTIPGRSSQDLPTSKDLPGIRLIGISGFMCMSKVFLPVAKFVDDEIRFWKPTGFPYKSRELSSSSRNRFFDHARAPGLRSLQLAFRDSILLFFCKRIVADTKLINTEGQLGSNATIMIKH